MAQTQFQRPGHPTGPQAPLGSMPLPFRPRNRSDIDLKAPVNQNGSFEADRVIKSGYVQKRTQKTKTWKSIYIVLRPNRLSVYKNEKENKLRHQLYLSDLTAVAFLKDPKHKRDNVFGLFSPSKNFHFQATNRREADSWVNLIRREARIEEEEEEMFLASPMGRRQIPAGLTPVFDSSEMGLSSSPEAIGPLTSSLVPIDNRRKSSQIESSGLSGNEFASHSDFSDNDTSRLPGASFDSFEPRSYPTRTNARHSQTFLQGGPLSRSLSQMSVHNVERDPDRVIWQGWLWFLRTKGGVRQWKHLWGVLRPRNFIMYKNESEYAAQHIIRLSAIVNVVDIDPLSKSKTDCLQIITEEKSYRFCTHDEESLIQCLGAFKSLLAKRREIEARVGLSQEQVR
ncbi:unnamed protein product [Clonostachys solani]|uniref:PH domain-containing protein n=1 Tax=Clonostachys solani TaxID=160281 RepID=A0A9N9YUT8_9HYPO|nr:unnamed protein product [Clonostachys solani]